MKHWPAVTKWADINYLLSVAGDRTVPIELGNQYTDTNWGQKLMTLRSFIENHFLNKSDFNRTGYLAQYNLFDQVLNFSIRKVLIKICNNVQILNTINNTRICYS